MPLRSQQAARDRIVEGRVLRPDSAGAPRPVAGQWVVLHRVGSDAAAPIDSVRSSASGAFRMRYRLTGSPDALYFVSAMYRGIAYFSPPLRAAVVRGGDADVYVYDTTTDTAGVRVQGRHVVLSLPRGDHREVAEIFEIENPGPRTVVARDSTRPVWATTMPAAADSMRVAPGDVAAGAVTFRPGRAELFAPLSPGLRQLVLTYTLPGRRFPVSIPVERETGVLEVLLEDPRASVRAPGLTEVAPATIDGRTFRRFLAQDVPRSAILVMDAPAPPADTGTAVTILLVAFTALMAGSLVYWFARRRDGSAAPVPAGTTSGALIAELAALDARFERETPDAASRERYETARASLKARIASALARENPRA